ncbi:transporter substrate-binding domain-containing protein [Frankia sp. Cpl3]|uniref:transporter substrate-binding domain-containing protein n=1 Tax=Parafrankia colletiae TaxID=573497 RepID=UPI000A8F4374|nr:transporter substrate-binding domain-containing protein [Parafrankia colletiae]MCK9901029.1 transporter substrate-binding domain-containing protein [Frankia sp. Cpl3]
MKSVRRTWLALVVGAAVTACSTVPAKLPAAADQPWGTLATASADPGASSIASGEDMPTVPRNLVPPMDPLPGPGSFPPGGSLQDIVDRGYLRVGVSRDTQLRGAWNPVAHQYEGFDVDIARRIADALFGPNNTGEADTIRYVPVSYSERLPAIENRRVDIVISTLTYTEARARRVGLSQAYFTAHPRLLTRRDPTRASTAPQTSPVAAAFADLAGKRVCAPRATTSLANLQQKLVQFGGFEIEGSLNELSDCLVAFQQGTVDAVAANDASLVGMLEQDATTELGDAEIGEREYYSVGFTRGDTELAGFVNGVLEGIRRDEAVWVGLCEAWAVAEMPCEGSRPPEPQWSR